jgi:hypothetical protein
MLIALTRIERAAESYCCPDDSDAVGIIADIKRFSSDAIVLAGTHLADGTTSLEEKR